MFSILIIWQLQGVHPEALKKVKDPEILDIVEGCIRTKKEER